MTPQEKQEKIKVLCNEAQELSNELYPLVFPANGRLGDNPEELERARKLHPKFKKKNTEIFRMMRQLLKEKASQNTPVTPKPPRY
jgi:hypothetical protein